MRESEAAFHKHQHGMLSFLVCYACLVLLLVITFTGCAEKRFYTKKFGSSSSGSCTIPEDVAPRVKFCWNLDLHPKDQILNIDLFMDQPPYKKKGVKHRYNPTSGELCITLDTEEIPLSVSKTNELVFRISYLAFYRLYEMGGNRQQTEIHSLATTERKLRFDKK